MWRAFGVFLEGWATAASGALGGGLEDMRRGVELLREQNVLMFDGLLKIALAEAEARAGDPDRAIAILDEALATCDRIGYRAFEAELHRARGEILLKRDPANPAPAEEAFLTAIAVAKQQGTRSFELRAALSLAKLYQSTGRPAEAHAVLAPALEGFSPTPEMPEIAEAQALLAALAETDEVKAAEAQRQRRLHLQTAYGNAMMLAQRLRRDGNDGRLRRARELASGDRGRARTIGGRLRPVGRQLRAGRTAVDAGARGGLPRATSRRDPIRPRPASPIALAGITHWFAGEYRRSAGPSASARSRCSNPAATTNWRFRFGPDPGVAAMVVPGDCVCGRSARSIARCRSIDARCRRGSRASRHAGTLALGQCMRRCSN